jgi:hypothetical protein
LLELRGVEGVLRHFQPAWASWGVPSWLPLPKALTGDPIFTAAMLLSSLRFGLAHADGPGERLGAGLDSLLWAGAYKLTGYNPLVPIVAHLAFNTLVAVSLADLAAGGGSPVPPVGLGSMVQVDPNRMFLRQAQHRHGGWDDRMDCLRGHVGQVIGFNEMNGDPIAAFPCGSKCHFSERALVPVRSEGAPP